MNEQKPVVIFYACDDRFARYTTVSLMSLCAHTSPDRLYHIHILHTDLTDESRAVLAALERDHVRIFFDNVAEHMHHLGSAIPLRDYYSVSTYYRIFIPDMFPEYDKVAYLDSDTILRADVADLFDTELGDAYLAAAHDQAFVQVPMYGDYAEKVTGVDRYAFFSAGVLVLNCRLFREKKMLLRFSDLMKTYQFVVTQDEDYLNVLCKDHVVFLPQAWNFQVFGRPVCPVEEACLIHYIMVSKPWHYADCPYADYFWEWADRSPYAAVLREELAAYTDEERAHDAASVDGLNALVRAEIDRPDNYLKALRARQAADRVEAIKRMTELEYNGIFDRDVEEDPPAPVLEPDDIEYVRRGPIRRLKTYAAFAMARRFVRSLMKKGQFIIKDIKGIEHFAGLDSGAIVTCNHFSALDSFAIHLAYYASGQKKRRFYRVIREGNYTGFPGFYGYLMRNCDTLPLSSNCHTMGKFFQGVNTLLKNGNFVLFYPEQSMWWNYRKPKPLKEGAYTFAARAGVPVLPCFITMRDSDRMGPDGFPVQEYTIHIAAPLYPDPTLDPRQQAEDLRARNFAVWKQIYEETYGMPLVYRREEDDLAAVVVGG